MKKKINRHLMLLSSLAVVITLLLMAAVFYHIFQKQVMDDLRLYAYAMAQSVGHTTAEGTYDYRGHDVGIDKNVRSTVVSPEGEVLYDSNADVVSMDNHAGRPEVQEAFRLGEGRSVRQSDTMKMNTYYFTLLLADGNVLRVSRDSHNIWSILYSSVPAILMTVCALLGVCLVVSRYLTKTLLAPIEQMVEDMDCIEEKNIYEELQPFARTISRQHEAILNNVNMRQEFSANVSHELKTPLTAISGYSELIENGMASGQDVLRFAAEIHKSAGRLLTLINDTLRLSELDVMDKEIPFEEVNLYAVARDSVEMLQLRAQKREVTLTLEGEDCSVWGDRQMIEELVYNLCDNAVSYNNVGGKVCVRAGRVDGSSFLCVEDTGIGIPEECQDRIFERFYRVDKSRSKSTGGTGLGLAIVKHIVAIHHAHLTLVSEPGRGTRVTVVF